MVFTYRYCRMLEDGSFRGRSSDFVMMFIFGGVLMTFFGIFVNLFFLGQAFTLMLVYVWSRRNPMVPMNFFGVLNFQVCFEASFYSISVIKTAFIPTGSLSALGVALLLNDLG